MDPNILLNWSITILITIALIVFFQIRKRKKEKKTISALQSFAKENNSTISGYDHWFNALIGIDNSAVYKLFFIRITNNTESREVIKLSEVRSCRLVKTERAVMYKKEKIHVIDKIALVFSYIDTRKPDNVLEFYNTDYDHLTMSVELQIAQKWLEIINNILIGNKNQISKAHKIKKQGASLLNEPVAPRHAAAYSAKRRTAKALQQVDAT